MPGVKGRSGRKSLSNEQYKFETLDECWKLVRAAINDSNLDYKYRVELASRHTVKSIPTELAGSVNATVTHMPAIQKEILGEADGTPENRIAEYLIGSPPSPEAT